MSQEAATGGSGPRHTEDAAASNASPSSQCVDDDNDNKICSSTSAELIPSQQQGRRSTIASSPSPSRGVWQDLFASRREGLAQDTKKGEGRNIFIGSPRMRTTSSRGERGGNATMREKRSKHKTTRARKNGGAKQHIAKDGRFSLRPQKFEKKAEIAKEKEEVKEEEEAKEELSPKEKIAEEDTTTREGDEEEQEQVRVRQLTNEIAAFRQRLQSSPLAREVSGGDKEGGAENGDDVVTESVSMIVMPGKNSSTVMAWPGVVKPSVLASSGDSASLQHSTRRFSAELSRGGGRRRGGEGGEGGDGVRRTTDTKQGQGCLEEEDCRPSLARNSWKLRMQQGWEEEIENSFNKNIEAELLGRQQHTSTDAFTSFEESDFSNDHSGTAPSSTSSSQKTSRTSSSSSTSASPASPSCLAINSLFLANKASLSDPSNYSPSPLSPKSHDSAYSSNSTLPQSSSPTSTSAQNEHSISRSFSAPLAAPSSPSPASLSAQSSSYSSYTSFLSYSQPVALAPPLSSPFAATHSLDISDEQSTNKLAESGESRRYHSSLSELWEEEIMKMPAHKRNYFASVSSNSPVLRHRLSSLQTSSPSSSPSSPSATSTRFTSSLSSSSSPVIASPNTLNNSSTQLALGLFLMDIPLLKKSTDAFFEEIREEGNAQLNNNTKGGLTPSSKDANKKKISERKKRKLQLYRYKSILKDTAAACSETMKLLKQKERKVIVQTKHDIQSFRTWANYPLIRSTRTLMQLKLARLSLQYETEQQKINVLNAKQEELAQIIKAMKVENSPISTSLFVEPTAMYTQDSTIRRLTKLLARVEKRKALASNAYVQLREFATCVDVPTRSSQLKELLLQTDTGGGHYAELGFHVLNEKKQSTFDGILLDQRFKEGMKVQRLLEALKEADGRFLPIDITGFLLNLLDEMMEDHNIESIHAPKLRLFISRCIFPVIHDYCFRLSPQPTDSYTPPSVYSCDFTNEKLLQLHSYHRSLPPKQLDIPPEYLQPIKESSANGGDFMQQEPYRAAAFELDSLLFGLVPVDMLDTIHSVVQLLNQEAKLRSGLSSISADAVLPLFAYALVQSLLIPSNNLRQIVAFMDNFAMDDEKRAQFGYCLTTFTAAISHVHSLEPALNFRYLNKGGS